MSKSSYNPPVFKVSSILSILFPSASRPTLCNGLKASELSIHLDRVAENDALPVDVNTLLRSATATGTSPKTKESRTAVTINTGGLEVLGNRFAIIDFATGDVPRTGAGTVIIAIGRRIVECYASARWGNKVGADGGLDTRRECSVGLTDGEDGGGRRNGECTCENSCQSNDCMLHEEHI